MCENLKKLVLLISLAGALLVNTNIFAQTLTPTSTDKIGGNRDSHGCLTSAGYSWCELGDSCVRFWELANCFETKVNPKFARKFSHFAHRYALNPDTDQPNNAIAAKKLCNSNSSFWDNIDSELMTDVLQACFPDSSNDGSFDSSNNLDTNTDSNSSDSSSKKPSLITIADTDLDSLTTVPANSTDHQAQVTAQPVAPGQVWCDTMRRNIDPQEFDLTDPKDFNDFCNPAALDTSNFF